MDQQILLFAMTSILLGGLVLLGLELCAMMRGLQGIAASVQAVAQMTTEVLHRLPER